MSRHMSFINIILGIFLFTESKSSLHSCVGKSIPPSFALFSQSHWEDLTGTHRAFILYRGSKQPWVIAGPRCAKSYLSRSSGALVLAYNWNWKYLPVISPNTRFVVSRLFDDSLPQGETLFDEKQCLSKVLDMWHNAPVKWEWHVSDIQAADNKGLVDGFVWVIMWL